MDLLLDFVNVKQWSCNELLSIFKKYKLFFSADGAERGYELSFYTRDPDFKDIRFFLIDDKHAREAEKAGFGVLPDDPRYNDLFKWLEVMQKTWRDYLTLNIDEGPNFHFLNSIAERTRFTIGPGTGKFDIRLDKHYADTIFIEDFIEFDYLMTFVTGQGEKFKRLRICQKTDCRKWYIYKHPKRVFCCDKCCKDFHNFEKNKSGKQAEYMRRKRAEGKYQ
jgi:hypothetical protein